MPTQSDKDTDVNAMITGWGRLRTGGPQPNTLQEVQVKVIQVPSYCKFYYVIQKLTSSPKCCRS